MLKILSWNIQQGGGSRVRGIVRFIQQQKAQIVVLSEFRNNDAGAFIRQKLIEQKYTYQFVSRSPSDTNSVLIASQIPCNSRLFVEEDWEYSHSVIALDFAAFHLYGVYLPHKKKHKLFDLLLREMQTKQPAIIAGDFNTGKNFIDQKGDSFWYTEDLKKLEAAGIKDAFRYLNGEAEVYSWYSHQGNGYRYDHTYCSEALLAIVKQCDYLPDARTEKLSDHSPMILELA